jgi:hypothetical protein
MPQTVLAVLPQEAILIAHQPEMTTVEDTCSVASVIPLLQIVRRIPQLSFLDSRFADGDMQ